MAKIKKQNTMDDRDQMPNIPTREQYEEMIRKAKGKEKPSDEEIARWLRGEGKKR